MTEQDTTGDSRRSFMAKGALATGALTLGTGAFGTATVQAQQVRVAVFANNYYPGASFEVVAPLEAGTTVDILRVDDETVPEISQPDEWGGHIIRYDIGQDSGITTFMFIRGRLLSSGVEGQIGDEATVLSSDLNLLSTTASGNSDTDNDTVEEETDNEDLIEEPEEEDTNDTENGGDE
ncbi:calcium-binding protein [Halopiger djelfimassiliensis]|uniref:calcium-binding protein n=1 Tax=Halopiger djelfimassiliensis TaxID=1293047 RepID=UPI00067803A2|nr:calcium-binding protein [Halopiger djelfimassiliensis]